MIKHLDLGALNAFLGGIDQTIIDGKRDTDNHSLGFAMIVDVRINTKIVVGEGLALRIKEAVLEETFLMGPPTFFCSSILGNNQHLLRCHFIFRNAELALAGSHLLAQPIYNSTDIDEVAVDAGYVCV